jgi:hypothetical protein
MFIKYVQCKLMLCSLFCEYFRNYQVKRIVFCLKWTKTEKPAYKRTTLLINTQKVTSYLYKRIFTKKTPLTRKLHIEPYLALIFLQRWLNHSLCILKKIHVMLNLKK